MRSGAAQAFALLLVLGSATSGLSQAQYFGREIGALSQLQHGVRGRVFAVDSRTIFLKDFSYDGEGPTAYFYVGTSKSPGASGASGATRVRDERGGTGPLRRYRGESITLSLPDGKTLKDLKWFSVWCDEYAVNFGDVSIPRDVQYPRPAKVGALRGVHGVSSDPVVVVDAQTLLVPNFSYDGEAPDAKFWVGRGDKPSPQGIRIADENGKEAPLRKYDKKTIVLTLPGELTVFDIGHFGVWCEAFTVNFGHVVLPRAALANVPPSLKMLGVSPQSKLNCEVLYDDLAFEVRWAIAGDSIVVQLVAKLEDGEYMSFGISGDPTQSKMVGGDVAVAWVDKATLKGDAVDYYLDAKSQCAGVRGSCPDHVFAPNTNSVHPLNTALVNGYSIVTYQRRLRAADDLDLPVLTNASQPIIWAIGPLNSKGEVSYHHHFTKGDKFIDFGRPPVWNCPMPEGEDESQPLAREPPSKVLQREPEKHREPGHDNTSIIKPNPVPTPQPVPKSEPWEIPGIQCYEPPDGVLYAQMGPTGGKQGYSAITGHVGWGISWFINGLLIPEINVVRGKKYTFVVEGGSDPESPAKYHPFYITNDPVGGYLHRSDKEKQGIEIYAGVRRSRTGEVSPTGVGRLCNWTPDPSGPDADDYPSFGAYQRSLTLVCEEGNPGVVTWIPDKNTPDTVYYQCFTHRHLGWKINVLDECDAEEGEESRLVETVALPEDQDLQSEESIQVHSRVTPDGNFLDQRKKIEKIINTKTNYNDFSSINTDGGLTGEVYRREPDRNQPYPKGQEYELPISKVQIKEVIQTIETLESKMKEDMRKNATQQLQKSNQYQVHEDTKELFLPELPFREEDEYFVEAGKLPESYLLPPNQRPLTLQSVLRPNGPNMRPPFRRPTPPEIKLRRPPPPPQMFQKGNGGYPLSMPNHGSHGMQKKPVHKHSNNRVQFNMNNHNNVNTHNSNMNGHNNMNNHNNNMNNHNNNMNNHNNMNRAPMPAIPPMKAMPPLHYPKPNFNQGPPKQNKIPSGPIQTIIMAKPLNTVPSQSQTLSLGQTDIIANQVVKSQIILPGAGADVIAQHSEPQQYFNKPGQIILGKPMEHPIPLDQQMTPTKNYVIRTPPTPTPQYFQSTTRRLNIESGLSSHNEVKSSDFIGESVDSSTLAPAQNTGFKPDSIVVESGFKPIIREPLMAAEDRIAEFEDNSNRREDTDVEEDYEESPQYISNHAFSSDKMTESFEPMFIPSPPDHILPTEDRTKEIFPSNHAKEDRPHPIYVKTENELNALFSKKNMEKNVPSDLVMESDRVSPQYLPPDPKLPKEHSQKLSSSDQTFTTYDGKTVSAATLTSIAETNNKPAAKLFSSKLPANTELLLKSPQFGPFKGETPPPVESHISKAAILGQPKDANVQNTKSTHLKLVSTVHKPEPHQDEVLKAEPSEKHEIIRKPDEIKEDEEENIEEFEDYEQDERRRKRDTKDTQFEMGEVEEQVHTTGHSVKNQMDFEIHHAVASASNTRLYWMTHIIVLMLWLKFF